jgi:dihydrofolate reductase
MGKVIAQASMSLDGFIADANDQAGPLFDWYNNGDVEVTGADPASGVFRTSQASADYLRAAWSAIGADVIGRRLFDLTNGWNGRPAVGDAVFVVTHQPPADWPFSGRAVHLRHRRPAQRAGPGASRRRRQGRIDNPRQHRRAGLPGRAIDEVRIDLVPVVLGAGVRFFGDYAGSPLLIDDPQVVQGTG